MTTLSDIRIVSRDIQAATVLREQLIQLAAGDVDFVNDTLEGEIDLVALIRSQLIAIGEDEAMASGLAAYQDQLQARKKRLEDRAELRRTLVRSAMDVSGRKTLETDVGTVTLGVVKPKAIVTNEADIPSTYWKAQAPRLDMSQLNKAIQDGIDVPGATKSNGGFTVTIRRK
jgi:hypothetical protein